MTTDDMTELRHQYLTPDEVALLSMLQHEF